MKNMSGPSFAGSRSQPTSPFILPTLTSKQALNNTTTIEHDDKAATRIIERILRVSPTFST